MRLRTRNLLSLGVLIATFLGAAEPDLKVTAFVYNYAGVPAAVLLEAEAQAGRVYRHGGIEIVWLDCPLSPEQAARYPACQVAPSPTRLAVRVVPRSMAERYRQPQDTFGFAQIPEDGSFGIVANVFSSDTEDLAKRRGMAQGVLLGHLTAHELGHLLLGIGSHSSSGIMHVPWHQKELADIAQFSMLFTPSEEEKMRAGIRARMAREQAALVGLNKK